MIGILITIVTMVFVFSTTNNLLIKYKNMKHIRILLLAALCSTWACTSDEATMQNPSEEAENPKDDLPTGWTTCKGEVNATINGYTDERAITRTDGTVANTWADGSKIYLVIESEGKKVSVVAVYSNTFAEWSFSYDASQTIPSTGTMVAHYFKDATTTDFTGATLNENSVVYTDSIAQYCYENNTFMVGIHLKPIYFRIRLAGVPGQQVTFSGMSRATSYSVNTGEMVKEDLEISLTASITAVDGRYYTSYVYGSWGKNDSIYTVLEDGNLYCRSLKETGLMAGKSVWTSIPSANYMPKGWEKASWKAKAVDLGLSVKWAACNVGATKPEDYGEYYAWGETEEKEDYSWGTYKWCNGSMYSLTKYYYDIYSSIGDNKRKLDLEDDVAHVKWGEAWRMPTTDEISELMFQCSWTWTKQNGKTGYLVTGTNGNSIFLPAAGYRSGKELCANSSSGYYLSAELNGEDTFCQNVYHLYFSDSDFTYSGWSYRGNGHTVRPVTD